MHLFNSEASVRCKAAMLVVLLVGVCWAQEAQATCITHPDGSWQCCAPGGPCSNGGGSTVAPLALKVHTSVGFGHSWVANQLDEVSDADAISGRILGGVEFWFLGLDVAIFGSDLASPLGTHSSFTFAGVFNVIIPVWEFEDDWGGLGLVPHVGYGWTVVTGQALGSHEGPSFSAGAQLRYDIPVEDEIAFRLFLDGNYEWIWLDSPDLQRHINAEMFQLTTGLGIVFGGF